MEEVVCRWLLIGPQGPGGWVMGDTGEVVYVLETHGEIGLNGKGLKEAGDVIKKMTGGDFILSSCFGVFLLCHSFTFNVSLPAR